MPRLGTRKCLNCHTFFKPEPRSKGHQRYCADPACRKASKRASQSKWLQKPENQHYFSGPENVQRVQQWRKNNSGYSKKSRSPPVTSSALQDVLITQPFEIKGKNDDLKQGALQELLLSQPAVLIGLIAYLTGYTLQDDIVTVGQKMRQLGEDYLNHQGP